MAQRKKVKKVRPKKALKPQKAAAAKPQARRRTAPAPAPVEAIKMQPKKPKEKQTAAPKAQSGAAKAAPVQRPAVLEQKRAASALKTADPAVSKARGAAKVQKMPQRPAAPKKSRPAGARPAPPKRQPGESPRSLFQLGLIRGRRKQVRTKRLVLCCTALVVAVLLGVYTLLSPTGPLEHTVNFFAALGGGKFPLTISGTELKAQTAQGGRVFVLTDSHILGVNAGGRAFLEQQHGFSNPAMKTSAERVLVYNRESTGYAVLNNSKELYRGDLKNIIYKGDICSKGLVAFVTSCDGYAAAVSVYTKSLKLKFTWYLTDGFISDIALSNNGKYIAVAAVNVQNGAYSSKVHCFSLKSETPLYTADFPETAVLSLQKVSGSLFAAVTQNNLTFLTFGENSQKSGTDQSATVSFVKSSPSGKRLAAVCGNPGAMTVYLYDAKGNTLNRFNFNDAMTDLAVTDRYLYILNNDTIRLLQPDGTEQSRTTVDRAKTLLAPCGSGVLAGDNSQIDYIRINPEQQSSVVSGSSLVSGASSTLAASGTN